MNYLIGVGAIILYLDIYFQVFPTTDPFVVEVLCHLIPWPTAIGYSLCYGTIVVKMIRVHLIFTNPKPRSKNVRERKLEYIEVHIYPISLQNLKDWKLVLGVFILVVIDLLILVPYTAIVGSNGVRVELILNKENPSRSEGVISVIGLYNNYFPPAIIIEFWCCGELLHSHLQI